MSKFISISIILILPAILMVSLYLPATLHAEHGGPHRQTTVDVCKNIEDRFGNCRHVDEGIVGSIAETVTNVLTAIIASISVLVLVIAGFMYILSAGKPDTAKRAKNTILYALAGIIVAFFAQVIVRFILSSV